MNKEDFDRIIEEIENMTDVEFRRHFEDARCGELRWLLEYAWDSELDEYLEWRLCFRQMWE